MGLLTKNEQKIIDALSRENNIGTRRLAYLVKLSNTSVRKIAKDMIQNGIIKGKLVKESHSGNDITLRGTFNSGKSHRKIWVFSLP